MRKYTLVLFNDRYQHIIHIHIQTCCIHVVSEYIILSLYGNIKTCNTKPTKIGKKKKLKPAKIVHKMRNLLQQSAMLQNENCCMHFVMFKQAQENL